MKTTKFSVAPIALAVTSSLMLSTAAFAQTAIVLTVVLPNNREADTSTDSLQNDDSQQQPCTEK